MMKNRFRLCHLKALIGLLTSLAVTFCFIPGGMSASQISDLLVEMPYQALQVMRPGVLQSQSFLIDESVLLALSDNLIEEVGVRVGNNDIVFQKIRHEDSMRRLVSFLCTIECVFLFEGEYITPRGETSLLILSSR